jgi:predicted transcriptional regulator
MEYFAGKDQAYGILLGQRFLLEKPIRPKSIFKEFRPPQSFRYLTAIELRRIGKQFGFVEELE